MWKKIGRIYCVSRHSDWQWSHTHKPTAIIIDNVLRIYFGVRDNKNITRTTFIDVEPDNPMNVLYEHDKPILDVGPLGAFDDSGANVSCVILNDDKYYMYYYGWNTSTTVPARNSIGIAFSRDGINFERVFDGPIMDRTPMEPYFTVAPFVIVEDGIFRMWYTSGTEWRIVNGNPEILYHIKYAESIDGINWKRDNKSCILPTNHNEVTARPSIVVEDNVYMMWYSKRSIVNFRTDRSQSYRIGYAESDDGLEWNRKDNEAGIDVSEKGWDCHMIEYPYVYKYNMKKYMLYNGNDFGGSGMGVASWREN